MSLAPAAAAIEFDAATHRYTVDGKRVPSVTQILKGCGIVDLSGVPPSALDYAAERGTAVHLFCQYLDEGVEDWLQVEGTPLEGYCRAYASFRAQTGFRPRLVEHRFVTSAFGMPYAGTLDREGVFDGCPSILDLKTGAVEQRSWAIQLAAYDAAMETQGLKRRRIAVQLKSDGSFRLHEYRDAVDYTIWRAALALEIWKGTK